MARARFVVFLQIFANTRYPAVTADAPCHHEHSCDAFDFSLLQNEVDVSKYDDDNPLDILAEGLAETLTNPEVDPASQVTNIMHQIEGGSPPPACVRDAPADAPYWKEEQRLLPLHADCALGFCGKLIQNGRRVESIRGLLGSTSRAMRDAGASNEWVIDHGTAIGALRCEDVLPWDSDCDVAVSPTGLAALYRTFFNTTDTGHVANRSHDLDERYALKSKTECIPFAFVDKTSGLYCDVVAFESSGVSLLDNARTGENPAPKLQTRSVGTWDDTTVPLGEGTCSNKGYVWNYTDVFPSKDCKIGEEVFPCANDLQSFLHAYYPSGCAEPDVVTAL